MIIFSKLVSTHTNSIKVLLHYYKHILSVESKGIHCSAVKKLQNSNCALQGLGIVHEMKKYVSIFLDGTNCSKFVRIQLT